jgi:hypothetical protein
VNNPEITHVESWNPHLGAWETRKILNKFKNPRRGRTVLKLFPDSGAEGLGSLTCSENHNLLRADGSKVMAGDLKVGDSLTVQSLRLTDQQNQIVLGSLLGDAVLTREYKSWRYTYKQSDDQKEYFDWKHKFFVSLGSSEIPQKKPNGGWGDFIWERSTFALHNFEEMVPYVYTGIGEKRNRSTGARRRVTEEWLSKIDERGLAVWFCDDGSASWYTYKSNRKIRGQSKFAVQGQSHCNSIQLATHNFPYEDQLILKKWLQERWGVTSEILEDNRGKGYYLAIREEFAQLFIDLVKDYVPLSMKYKVGGQGQDLWGEIQIPQMGLSTVKLEKIKELTGSPCYDQDNWLFNIEVEDNHNYCAAGILVANCQKIKNPETALAKVAKEAISFTPRVHGLTATLVKNKAHDAWSIIETIAPGTVSKAWFEKEYCVYEWERRPILRPGQSRRKMAKVPVLKGYRNLDQFLAQISHLYLARTDDEIDLQRPEVVHVTRYCQLNSVHRKIYDDAEQGLYVESACSDEHAAGAAVCHAQLAANTPESFLYKNEPDKSAFDHPDYARVQEQNAKLNLLKEILEVELEDEPVIIYSRFATTIRHLRRALQSYNPAVIMGEVSSEDRESEKKRFMQGDTNTILITDAGGEALNMQRARHVIYYNRPFDPGTYIQILGRARRFGAVHNHLVAWHLSAKDTVDELVDSILTAKFGPFDEIVRNRGTLMPESESLPLEVARRARQARIHRNHS